MGKICYILYLQWSGIGRCFIANAFRIRIGVFH